MMATRQSAVAKEITWDRTSVKQAFFALTDEKPVQLQFSVHSRLTDTLRDMHFELEVGVVRSGRMERQYEGWQTEVGPGGVWFCGTWEPHGFRIVKAPCDVAVFVVSQAYLARLALEQSPHDWLAPFAAQPKDRPASDKVTAQALLDLASRLKILLSDDPSRASLWGRLLLQELLLLVTRGWAAPSPDARRSPEPFALIGPALHLVSQSKRFVPVEQAAAACSVSRNTFSRRFRDAMGIDFSEFALRSRMKSAAMQLISTTMPVKAIAYEWGFSDQSHLHHCFARYYGCTPSEYREGAKARQLPR
jgi:AraC-like DNA-binding protein